MSGEELGIVTGKLHAIIDAVNTFAGSANTILSNQLRTDVTEKVAPIWVAPAAVLEFQMLRNGIEGIYNGGHDTNGISTNGIYQFLSQVVDACNYAGQNMYSSRAIQAGQFPAKSYDGKQISVDITSIKEGKDANDYKFNTTTPDVVGTGMTTVIQNFQDALDTLTTTINNNKDALKGESQIDSLSASIKASGQNMVSNLSGFKSKVSQSIETKGQSTMAAARENADTMTAK